jgi:hypothetical protein
VDIKKTSPDTLLIVRECKNADPNIIARYDFGAEKKVVCEFASTEEVEEIVSNLVLEADKMNSYIESSNKKI